MPIKAKIQVLRAFGPLARSFAAYNADNFNRKLNGPVFTRNILQAVGCTVLFVSLIGVSSLNCWMCFEDGLNWRERFFHVGLTLAQVQQVLFFVCMTKKSPRIIAVLRQIQAVVDKREFLQFYK